MKQRTLLLSALAVATLTLAGCENKSQPEENAPAATNAASGQSMPEPAAPNKDATPAPANSAVTNNSAPASPNETNSAAPGK